MSQHCCYSFLSVSTEVNFWMSSLKFWWQKKIIAHPSEKACKQKCILMTKPEVYLWSYTVQYFIHPKIYDNVEQELLSGHSFYSNIHKNVLPISKALYTFTYCIILPSRLMNYLITHCCESGPASNSILLYITMILKSSLSCYCAAGCWGCCFLPAWQHAT